MTRGKLFFMFGGLCLVAILLWIAAMMQTPAPGIGVVPVPTANASPSPTGDFYIAGHVHHTGMLDLKTGETIKDAITEAGGADSAAAELIVRLVRKEGVTTSTRSIPLAEVLSGASDEKVQLGDVIDIVQQATPATLPVVPMSGTDSSSSTLITPPGSQ